MIHHKSAATDCPNCGTGYADENATFCHHCGQARRDIQSPLRFWIFSFFESFFNYDSRLWRTVRTLLLKPGYISSDFNAGRRVRYVEPFRLYLLISVAFFLLQSMLPKEEQAVKLKSITQQYGDTVRLNINFVTTSFPTTIGEMKQVCHFNQTQMDSFLVSKDLSSNLFSRMLMKGTSRLISGDEKFNTFDQSFNENISRVMFFLVPVFAFLIWLMFRNRVPYYISHLVFALHFHSAFFLIFLLIDSPKLVFGDYGQDWISWLICIVYLFLSLRTVYGESRLITWIKQFSAMALYGIAALCGVTVAALVSLASF